MSGCIHTDVIFCVPGGGAETRVIYDDLESNAGLIHPRADVLAVSTEYI